jgi:CPA2 family monovalent cation:H+ antiporter-2
MGSASLAYDLALALSAALVGGFVATRMRIPAVVGFMVAGIMVGPFTPGLSGDVNNIQLLAEIGVVLLMFGVGVDFSINQLRSVQKVATFGGSGQVILTILLGIGIGVLLGWPWGWQLYFGCILALSSTTVLLKLWMDRGELGSQHGQVTVGISLIQDLSTVLMIVLLPALTAAQPDTNPLVQIGWSLLRASIFFGLMLLLGTRLFPWLLAIIAQRSSREMFLLATIVLSVGTAIVATEIFGLSLALGAFMAGLVVSESELHYRILGEVLPIRDIFAVLFFVSVGMLIDPMFVWDNFGLVLAISTAIVVGKFLILALVLLPFSYSRRTVLMSAAGLAQIGEFSFILAQQGVQAGVLDNFVYSLTLSGALLSTVATPFMLRAMVPVATWLDERFPPKPAHPGEELPAVPSGLGGHIVICGYGRLGVHLVEALRELDHQYLVIDQDWFRVQEARQNGALVIYGDASMRTVLEGANLDTAQVVAVTIPDQATHRLIVQQIRDLCPFVPIVARARLINDLAPLYNDGANEVILPSFEGGLEMLRQTLLRLGVPAETIQSYIDTIHTSRYEPWRKREQDVSDESLLSCLRRAGSELTIQWHQLPDDSIYSGYSIASLNIRQRTGASIVAIVREGEVIVNPEVSTILQGGDRIAVIGNEEQRQSFIGWLRDSHIGMTVPARLPEPEADTQISA